ncbi:PREDICTED: uncharacterized protein LOC109156249 [Ipomoea nil]|uniref:uncharacterized protein LOC109156249 n=1 Tax=Ipomoea nil TaxID=35883 RepID=UPI00090141C6|nr:PREDICTED: uncharacterized protein LOC109156249 [Ipomoea nil]
MAASSTNAGMAGLTARWADLVLEEEEASFEPTVEAEGGGVVAGSVEESWGIVGRFLTRKLVKLEFMSHVTASDWHPVSGVQAMEIQPGLFLFVFHHITDVQRVLNEGPLSFGNSTLVCKQVPDGAMQASVVLDMVDMWVQVHDLPMGYTSELILEHIGNFLRTFVKSDDRFVDVPWRAFYRIRVLLPIDKPIKRRMKFIKRDKTSCWVSFRYEWLHTYCFFCGMLGHVYKFCRQARDSVMSVEEYPYGPELRAGGSRGPRPIGGSWLLLAGTGIKFGSSG